MVRNSGLIKTRRSWALGIANQTGIHRASERIQERRSNSQICIRNQTVCRQAASVVFSKLLHSGKPVPAQRSTVAIATARIRFRYRRTCGLYPATAGTANLNSRRRPGVSAELPKVDQPGPTQT